MSCVMRTWAPRSCRIQPNALVGGGGEHWAGAQPVYRVSGVDQREALFSVGVLALFAGLLPRKAIGSVSFLRKYLRNSRNQFSFASTCPPPFSLDQGA